jgi:hypothetical protein
LRDRRNPSARVVCEVQLLRADPSRSLAADRAREARLLLEAAGRCLKSLEHPSGYKATHQGPELVAFAERRIAAALAIVKG